MANFKSYLYNEYKMYTTPGVHVWTKPADIDQSKPILVHVWGAGGTGADGYLHTSTYHGGGGGGLAVKLINPSSLGATENITIGEAPTNYTLVSGSSSFGSHCSATGGNGGGCTAVNAGSNGGTAGAANQGIGGMGIGGDVNRRGGTGGTGYYASATNNGGGGGGSAPAPYGISDGFRGGNGYTYAGGGGGGIGAAGGNGDYIAGAGGGSAGVANRSQSPSSYYGSHPGGSGIAGVAGSAGTTRGLYTTYGDFQPIEGQPGEGAFIVNPNTIFFGGGGGSDGFHYTQSSYRVITHGTDGGPGAGGGGSGKASTYNHGGSGGNGGILGGGGGVSSYTRPGSGGLAGGGGGCGYYQYTTGAQITAGVEDPARGGNGLVIVQYARKL
jgi:hypothetical protein